MEVTSDAPVSTAVAEPPAAPVSQAPTKAAQFPGVALGEREPVAQEPAKPASQPVQESGQQTEPEDIPDDLLEKFEKHPKFQSRVDKAAASAVKAYEKTWQSKQAETAALAARQAADAEFEAMLEQVSNGTFVDEGTRNTAQKALLQKVQGRERYAGQMETVNAMAAQAEAAYSEIPEFKSEDVLTKVRQASMGSYTDYLKAVAQAVREQTTAELTAKFEKERGKLAEALKEDVRGEVRASMRMPDLGTESASARATQGFQYLEDAEEALMEGRISTPRFRFLSRTLVRRGRAA